VFAAYRSKPIERHKPYKQASAFTYIRRRGATPGLAHQYRAITGSLSLHRGDHYLRGAHSAAHTLTLAAEGDVLSGGLAAASLLTISRAAARIHKHFRALFELPLAGERTFHQPTDARSLSLHITSAVMYLKRALGISEF